MRRLTKQCAGIGERCTSTRQGMCHEKVMGGNWGGELNDEEHLFWALEFENVNRCAKDPQRRIGVLASSSGLRRRSNTLGRMVDPLGMLGHNSTRPYGIQGRIGGTQTLSLIPPPEMKSTASVRVKVTGTKTVAGDSPSHLPRLRAIGLLPWLRFTFAFSWCSRFYEYSPYGPLPMEAGTCHETVHPCCTWSLGLSGQW